MVSTIAATHDAALGIRHAVSAVDVVRTPGSRWAHFDLALFLTEIRTAPVPCSYPQSGQANDDYDGHDEVLFMSVDPVCPISYVIVMQGNDCTMIRCYHHHYYFANCHYLLLCHCLLLVEQSLDWGLSSTSWECQWFLLHHHWNCDRNFDTRS